MKYVINQIWTLFNAPRLQPSGPLYASPVTCSHHCKTVRMIKELTKKNNKLNMLVLLMIDQDVDAAFVV